MRDLALPLLLALMVAFGAVITLAKYCEVVELERMEREK